MTDIRTACSLPASQSTGASSCAVIHQPCCTAHASAEQMARQHPRWQLTCCHSSRAALAPAPCPAHGMPCCPCGFQRLSAPGGSVIPVIPGACCHALVAASRPTEMQPRGGGGMPERSACSSNSVRRLQLMLRCVMAHANDAPSRVARDRALHRCLYRLDAGCARLVCWFGSSFVA